MLESFDHSQETLKEQRFNVVYDEISMKIVDMTGGNKGDKNQKLKRISYFSDFIFMQQLMTLEVDIVLGYTKNSMKHLGKNTNDSDDDDKNKKDAPAANKKVEKF